MIIGVVLLRETYQLVTGDAEGKIRFWDLYATMEKIASFEAWLQAS